MKIRNIILGIALSSFSIFFQSCENIEVPEEKGADYGILPEKFRVDIPSSISKQNFKSAASADTMKGNEIYEFMGFFIAVGEEASEIVEDIIHSIVVHDIDRVKEVVFESDEDYRIKKLEVVESVEFEGKLWEYMLTITDTESVGNEDGGKAIQVLWNKSPIEGIAILKPYNIDRRDNEGFQHTMFRIDYSSVGNDEYDATMMVEISDFPLGNPEKEPFALQSMKMFVGKDGDAVDVFGNSNHPNAKFFTDKAGFNWAFVASGYEKTDLGVAEVGLPESTINSDSREVLLKENSIKNVFTEEFTEFFVKNWGIKPDSSELAAYLTNADAPGFFNRGGFVQGGTSPGIEWNGLEDRINNLSPYNPATLKDLSISFK